MRVQIQCLLILFFTVTLLGCTSSKSQKTTPSEQLEISVQAGRMGHKPWDQKASLETQIIFSHAVFTSLVNINRHHEISPGIFQDWLWNDELSQYEFVVDTSLVFSESRPLRLEDIEFAFLKMFLSKKITPSIEFKDILGSEKLRPGMPFVSGMCDGVVIQEPNKVVVRLNRKNPLFLFKLSELMNPVAPIEDFKSDLFNFKSVPRGTGNYKVDWSDPQSSFVRLKIKDGVVLPESDLRPRLVHFYGEGTSKEHDVDISVGPSNLTLEGNKAYRKVKGNVAKMMNVLDFNFSNPLGKSELFRQAVSMAIDREAIGKVYEESSASHELTLPFYHGYTGSKFEYSPKKSREILERLFQGKKFDRTKKIIAKFHGPLRIKTKKYVEVLKKQFKAVGLNVEFSPFEDLKFGEKNSEDIVFIIYGLATSFVDPASIFENYQPGNMNGVNYDKSDQKAQGLYEKVLAAGSRTDQADLIKKMTSHYQSRFSYLPIQKFSPLFLVKKEKIESIGLDSSLFYVDLNYVSVKK